MRSTSQGIFPGPVPPNAIKSVIIYDDLEAAQSAMQTAARLLHKAVGEVDSKTAFWQFNLLESPNWRMWATADMHNSDLLIIATRSESGLPGNVAGWLKDAVAQKPDTDCAVMAVFGHPGKYDNAQSPRLQFVRQIVEGAGLNFFAPGIQPGNPDNLLTVNLHAQEEAITPTLDRILHLADRPAH